MGNFRMWSSHRGGRQTTKRQTSEWKFRPPRTPAPSTGQATYLLGKIWVQFWHGDHFQIVSFPPFLSTFCNLLERKSYCQLSVWAKCHVRHVSCLAATFKSVFPPYIDIEEMWQRMVRIFLLWLRPLTSLICSQNCCFPLSTCSIPEYV